MSVIKVDEQNCLRCGHRINRVGDMEVGEAPDVPQPGSLVLCIRCGAVMLLSEEGKLRGMSDQEMDELVADTATMKDLAEKVRRVHIVRHMVG